MLNIGDDIPQIIGTTPVTLQLDEDALADANADSAPRLPGEADFGGQTTASVDLTTFFSVGADQPGTFQFTAGAVAALDALRPDVGPGSRSRLRLAGGRHDHRLDRTAMSLTLIS